VPVAVFETARIKMKFIPLERLVETHELIASHFRYQRLKRIFFISSKASPNGLISILRPALSLRYL
jgi:hypothetical protein